MKSHRLIQTTFISLCSSLLLVSTGCNSIPKRHKESVPKEFVLKAEIPGLPNARHWGDEQNPFIDEILASSTRDIKTQFPALYKQELSILAISGGGANGAYGAGIMLGWTQRGDRPTFSVISGISTGAIMAPFVFLGPDYDGILLDLYTKKSTDDVLIKRNRVSAVRRDALMDTQPLRELLLSYIGDLEVERIAAEYRKGRQLLIGTVNIDIIRPVSWNIGAIANSGHPEARELIVEIILASAAIPAIMPPIFIDVEANGEVYQEMHVDGGLCSQVMVSPISTCFTQIKKKLQPKGQTQLFIIRNAKLHPSWKDVRPKLSQLASRSISSLIRTQGIGNIRQLYLTAQRDDMGFNLASIPKGFNEPSDELFDTDYMNHLFDEGFQAIKDGTAWAKQVD